MARLRYLIRSIARWTDKARFACPNCESSSCAVVDRKYMVTSLCRCRDCDLLFRTPTDPPVENLRFYEAEYSQGFTTELPNRAALEALKETNFAASDKDYSSYIAILRGLGVRTGARVLDFGCSWGYGSYQLSKAGFETTAFEIAPTRGAFAARELGVRLLPDLDEGAEDAAHRGAYDCFFSAHVLEHVPIPRRVFDYAMKLLKPGGIFVSFTPNGSAPCRSALPEWSRLWGEVHPHFIDDTFLDRSFANSPRAFGSNPVGAARLPAEVRAIRLDDLSRPELFFAARKLGEGW